MPVNDYHCQPIWVFSDVGSFDTGMPAEARGLAMTALRWYCLTFLPGARLQRRFIYLFVIKLHENPK